MSPKRSSPDRDNDFFVSKNNCVFKGEQKLACFDSKIDALDLTERLVTAARAENKKVNAWFLGGKDRDAADKIEFQSYGTPKKQKPKEVAFSFRGDEDTPVYSQSQVRRMLSAAVSAAINWKSVLTSVVLITIVYFIGVLQYGDWFAGLRFLVFGLLLWLVFFYYLLPFFGLVAVWMPGNTEMMMNFVLDIVGLAPSNAATVFFWIAAIFGLLACLVISAIIVWVIVDVIRG